MTALGSLASIVGPLYLLGAAAVGAAEAAGALGRGAEYLHDLTDPKGAAVRQAVRDYSPFDRSTWADPTSSWFNSGPRVPGVAGYTNGGLTPVYVVNPHDIGNAVSGGLGDGATRPPSGPSSFNGTMDLSPHGVAP